MSDTQTHCGHRFIIVVASGGTSGHRKLVMRSGVRAGRERDEGREERQTCYYICPKSEQKLLMKPVQLLQQNRFKNAGLLKKTKQKTHKCQFYYYNCARSFCVFVCFILVNIIGLSLLSVQSGPEYS